MLLQKNRCQNTVKNHSLNKKKTADSVRIEKSEEQERKRRRTQKKLPADCRKRLEVEK